MSAKDATVTTLMDIMGDDKKYLLIIIIIFVDNNNIDSDNVIFFLCILTLMTKNLPSYRRRNLPVLKCIMYRGCQRSTYPTSLLLLVCDSISVFCNCCCATGLITFTVLFYGVFLATTILLYIFYANGVSMYMLVKVLFRMTFFFWCHCDQVWFVGSQCHFRHK